MVKAATAAADRAGNRGGTRRPRGSLSSDEIVTGALDLMATENGLDGLSMPRLAKHLGVGVTSIYWYFRSKDELVAALTEHAAGQMWDLLPGQPELPWDERIAGYFRSFRRIFTENPVLADLVVVHAPLQARTPQAAVRFLSLLEREIGALIDAGFTDEDATTAYTTLSVYTRGCILNQRIYGQAEKQVAAGGLPLPEADTDPHRLPLMARLVPHYTPSMANDERFEAGLALILDGLRVRLATNPRSAAKGAAKGTAKGAAKGAAKSAAKTAAKGGAARRGRPSTA